MKLIDFLMGMIIILSFGYGCYMFGVNSVEVVDPSSNYFWIDNNRVNKDSIIDCSSIYEDEETIIGCWIKVQSLDGCIYIECLNTDYYTYEEFRDSWVMAFEEGVNK